MKNLAWAALLMFMTGLASAQERTGFLQDFNDGTITGWSAGQATTFALSAAEGALKIDYDRTLSSWEWDNFNFIPPEAVDVSGNLLLTVRVKSTINTTLSMKAVYAEGPENALIDYSVMADGLWHTATLHLPATGNMKIIAIYGYLDGGSTTPRSGTMVLDDFRLGDSAFVVADFLELERAVTATEQLLASSVEGSGEGEFPSGSRAMLQGALDAAAPVLAGGPQTQQAIIDLAVWDLYDACATFESSVNAAQMAIFDPFATKATRYLLMNLNVLAPNALLFGMHDVTGYGVGWTGDDDRSDVKSVCDDYPAVYSEDMSVVETNGNLDRARYRMTSAYNRGAVITMCWHQRDPDNRGFYAEDVNNERIVSTIIPGGARHQDYKNKLRNIASFVKSLRGAHGEAVPIIFRPYHEHVGNWFWWGPAHATTQEYNTLWQFTAHYLRDSLNVHNLLWALSPSLDIVEGGKRYFDIYPGDSYVDILGADNYFGATVGDADLQFFSQNVRSMVSQALTRGKLSALTEVGQEGLTTPNWFTAVVLAPIKNDTISTNLSYAAVWRNANSTHHFAPYPGDASVPDFMQFYDDPYTLFERDLPLMYQKPQPDSIPPFIVSLHDSVYVSPATDVRVTVRTNERSFMKYSYADQPFDAMPHAFPLGEGGFTHTVTIPSQQGESGTIFVRAKDIFGNAMRQSTAISFMVDTLEAPIAWMDPRYPVGSWSSGPAPLGTDLAALTKVEPVRTVYFRTTFTLTELPTAVGMLVKSYGGAVVHLNGQEISRLNVLASVPVDYDTDPTSAMQFNKSFVFDSTARKLLLSGDNVLGVEVHVPAAGSIPSFDVQVINQSSVRIVPLGSSWTFFDRGYAPAVRKLRDIMGAPGERTGLPAATAMYPNYPNPFNPSTRIRYEIAQGVPVTLEVFDVLGRRVAILVDEFQHPGQYEVQFSAGNVASGIYFLRMKAGLFARTQKMTLIR